MVESKALSRVHQTIEAKALWMAVGTQPPMALSRGFVRAASMVESKALSRVRQTIEAKALWMDVGTP